jgi:hypothetical protein
MGFHNKKVIAEKMEIITRKWWFYVLLVGIPLFIPPYASKGYTPENWGDVISYTLAKAFIYEHGYLFPIFKILPVVLILSVIILKNKARAVFAAYLGCSYIFFGIGQSIAFSDKYGISIVMCNLVMFTIIAFFWFWEISAKKNNFSSIKWRADLLFIIPLAAFAFWAPVEIKTGQPDFSLVNSITNPAGVTFCMMTPLYLMFLMLYYPKINLPAFRVTCVIAIVVSLFNIIPDFFVLPKSYRWNGVLHLPLLILPVYGMIISFRKMAKHNFRNERPIT